MKDTLRFLLLTIVFGGCRHRARETNRTFQEGSFTIKARFVDGRRSGRTEVIDSLGRLTGVLNYNNDSMSGICIHYFSDGVVSDSVMYRCDKPQGYWRHYAPDGDLRHINYFYFGLQFGPDLWYYKDRILKSFSFLDFEREPIVECTYNTHGNLDSIRKMDLKVILTDKEKNGTPVVEFFAELVKDIGRKPTKRGGRGQYPLEDLIGLSIVKRA